MISDTKSGKFYIGSSINVRRRIVQHVYSFNKNKHSNPIMQAIWNADPNRFNFTCLENLDGADKETLLRSEQTHLDRSQVGKNPLCMNVLLIANSHLGIKRRPESIEKLRKVHIGRKVTEETRLKQRAAKLGKNLSEEHKRRIGDAVKGKPCNRPKGILMPTLRKLTNDQVKELRKLKSDGASYSQLQKKYSLAIGTIQRIILKQSYMDVE